MQLKRIFLDLDDVLNKFTVQALEHVGCKVTQQALNCYYEKVGWDILNAANWLRPNNILTRKEFWDIFNREDWANFPVSDEFEWLLDNCEALVGKENICILTSPVLDPGCAAGKMEWIYKHCPKWLHRQYLIGPPKHLCAHPNALLIDDSDKNVNEFSKYGGQAILVPRPWNSLHGKNTMKYLRDSFNELLRPFVRPY